MIVDQITKFKRLQGCTNCGAQVLHSQCVVFDPIKTYVYVPSRHRRPDGSTCSNVAVFTKGERHV